MTSTFRARTIVRRLTLVAVAVAATLGLTATSAWALNHQTYNRLKNADSLKFDWRS